MLQCQLCDRSEEPGTPGSCGRLSSQLGCCGGLLQQSELTLLLAMHVCLYGCPSLVFQHCCQLLNSVTSTLKGAVHPLQSCGICKEMLKHYAKLCKEVQAVS